MMVVEMFLLSLAGLLPGSAGQYWSGALDGGMSARTSGTSVRTVIPQKSCRAGGSELRRLERVVLSLGGKPPYARILLRAARQFHIDPILLASVAHVESTFRPRVRSKCGALGLMQLRPIVMEVLGVTNPWDPYQNIMAGSAYLQHCFDRYENHSDSTYLALAAYNIGPGPVRKLVRSASAKRFVKKVLSVYNKVTDVPISVSHVNRRSATKHSAMPRQAQLEAR